MSHNKMLIDATHPEETRVVVLRDGRVEEFDYESAARKLLRGNIFLAKVTRVEPSLQAAFVDYGGNRHGFLAFNEIHPDYYQIPMADRMALLEEEAAAEAAEEAAADAHAERLARRRERQERLQSSMGQPHDGELAPVEQDQGDDQDEHDEEFHLQGDETPAVVVDCGADTIANSEIGHEHRERADHDVGDDRGSAHQSVDLTAVAVEPRSGSRSLAATVASPAEDIRSEQTSDIDDHDVAAGPAEFRGSDEDILTDIPQPIGLVENEAVEEIVNGAADTETVEQTGAEDALEELPERPRRRPRSYKIQEVIKRRQVVLVQVVKEERGNKGAALTTYLSLAGRYTVLMPNTARGGGISRKITNPADRKRLKEIAAELDVPEGMGLIIRTAGAARTRQEIKRDYEYLLRLWESVRELTLQSTAPSLVYEEGDLIKRSIRDLYNKDIEEIIVAGEEAYREAKDFMRMLMPSHAKNVVLHTGPEPLFIKYGIERQLNAMFSPYVTLRSGGYLVINQTEALVAIDVNSGKSTREFSIEETAFNTNLEAADEIARQLKLRDLAGLIVIDFIDMEEKRNNRAVERRLKEALRFDRARIQLGRISHFGLMEMSRQRLRTGVLEGSTSQCPHCQGTGIIRSTESVALAVLRGLEDALMAGRPESLVATTTVSVALYILNNKRRYVNEMEARHGVSITIQASDKMQGATFTIEKGAQRTDALRRPERAAVNMDWGFEGEDPETSREAGRADVLPPDNDDKDRDAVSVSLEKREEVGRGRRRRRRRGRRDGERGGREEALGRGGLSGPHLLEPAAFTVDEGDDFDEDLSQSVSAEMPDLEDAEPLATRGPADPRENPHEGSRTGEERGSRRRRRGRRGGRRGRGCDGGEGARNGEASNPSRFPDRVSHVTEEFIDDFSGAVPFQDAAGDSFSGETSASDSGPATSRWQERDQGERAALEVSATLPTIDEPARTEPANFEPASPVQTRANSDEDDARLARRRRVEVVASEPRIERVVVGIDETGMEVSEAQPAPVRRGWWQRRLDRD